MESEFPSLERLVEVLSIVFVDCGAPLTVLTRQPNEYSSTFKSEIVHCRTAERSPLTLFCKYGFPYTVAPDHQRGVPYEAEVYRRILDAQKLSVPRFFGSHYSASSGRTWLVTEYLLDCERVDISTDPEAVKLAARWVGQFHAWCDSNDSIVHSSFLNTYDASFYEAWLKRMESIPNSLRKQYPWLQTLEAKMDVVLDYLVAAPATVVHGEYYPNNVLIRDGMICVVDWETAGTGAGELDLAALTQGPWSKAFLQACEKEYLEARWPSGPPPNAATALTAARVFFCFQLLFHWLRFDPNLVDHQTRLFQKLLAYGKDLGVI
jgi:hypothetical protein